MNASSYVSADARSDAITDSSAYAGTNASTYSCADASTDASTNAAPTPEPTPARTTESVLDWGCLMGWWQGHSQGPRDYVPRPHLLRPAAVSCLGPSSFSSLLPPVLLVMPRFYIQLMARRPSHAYAGPPFGRRRPTPATVLGLLPAAVGRSARGAVPPRSHLIIQLYLSWGSLRCARTGLVCFSPPSSPLLPLGCVACLVVPAREGLWCECRQRCLVGVRTRGLLFARSCGTMLRGASSEVWGGVRRHVLRAPGLLFVPLFLLPPLRSFHLPFKFKARLSTLRTGVRESTAVFRLSVSRCGAALLR